MAKILIVDDSNSIIKAISRRLTQSGHEIVGAGNDGNEGFKLFCEKRPDLVLLDITMPNKDGRACLGEIIAQQPSAKVVMLSSVCSPDVIQECLNLGAKAFINKAEITTEGAVESHVDKVLKAA